MQVLLKIDKESTTKGDGTACRKRSSSRKKDRCRSTGPVDRRAQHAQDGLGRPARSTGELCLTSANSRVGSVDRPGRPIPRD